MKRIFLIQLYILIAGFDALHGQIVTTQFGQIQGSLNGSVYEFLGIPFAKPPVDSLRWQAPQNPENWAGVINTISFAPACPQKSFKQGDTTGVFIGNEDCLYLNIWTPKTGTGNLPVMVFIHGGGNQQGSTSEVQFGTNIYSGKNMAERGNAVVVTIQYRLGPLGYLVHPGLELENINGVSGNYGVLDQILALKWIRNNISNFGGDTSKTMIFGESAGGVNVGNLLTTPLAAGLFQRACIESAGPVLNAYADSKNSGITYVDNYITTGTNTEKIAYMRSVPADSLVKSETSPTAGGIAQMHWQPVIDNVIFSGYPMQTFQTGVFNKVPLMIGSNSEEMSLSAPAVVYPFMVTALINTYVPAAYKTQALMLYPPGTNNTEARKSYVGILTDAQFTTITRRTAQCVSKNQSENVWRYFFTHKHTIAQLATYGSYHGMELFYVFNNWENTTLGSGILFHAQDDSVQKRMLKYWVNFANTGNPNGIGLVNWPDYHKSADCYLEIKATPNGSQCGLRTVQTDLWDAVSGFKGCISTTEVTELKSSDDLVLYPNPAQNSFILDLPPQFCILNITDINGKNIYTQKGVSSKANIACSNFPNGIYIVQLNDGIKIRSGKIIILR